MLNCVFSLLKPQSHQTAMPQYGAQKVCQRSVGSPLHMPTNLYQLASYSAHITSSQHQWRSYGAHMFPTVCSWRS